MIRGSDHRGSDHVIRFNLPDQFRNSTVDPVPLRSGAQTMGSSLNNSRIKLNESQRLNSSYQ